MEQIKVYKEADVKNLGRVLYYDQGSFDVSLGAIKNKGADIITAKQLAYARMQRNKTHSLSQNGSYIKEGSLFVPKAEHKRYLLRESLVLENPEAVVQAHRAGKECSLGENFDVVKYLETLPKGSYLVLDNLKPVSTEGFGDDEKMVWLFGELAKDYGLFLNKAGVKQTGFYFYTDNDSGIDAQKQPFANQAWLHRVDNDSNVYGNDRDLHYDGRVRGVLVLPAKQAALEKQPTQVLYTPKHIVALKKVLHKEGISGDLEARIVSGLKR